MSLQELGSFAISLDISHLKSCIPWFCEVCSSFAIQPHPSLTSDSMAASRLLVEFCLPSRHCDIYLVRLLDSLHLLIKHRQLLLCPSKSGTGVLQLLLLSTWSFCYMRLSSSQQVFCPSNLLFCCCSSTLNPATSVCSNCCSCSLLYFVDSRQDATPVSAAELQLLLLDRLLSHSYTSCSVG